MPVRFSEFYSRERCLHACEVISNDKSEVADP